MLEVDKTETQQQLEGTISLNETNKQNKKKKRNKKINWLF